MDNEGGCVRASTPQWTRDIVVESTESKTAVDQDGHRFPWTAAFLFVLTGLGLVATLIEYLKWGLSTNLVSTVVWAVSLLLVVVIRPRTCSLSLTALFLAVVLCQAASLILLPTRNTLSIAYHATSTLLGLMALCVVLNMPLRHPFFSRPDISKPFTSPTAELRSPEDDLTMWQWMTVSWMDPLISLGCKRQLNDEDVWSLPYTFQHSQLHEAFRHLSGTVVHRLIKATWVDLVIMTFLALIQLATNYSAPVLLQQLLKAMKVIDTEKRPAITWALLTLLVELVSVQCYVFGMWFSRRAYERSRGAMITMLHEKVLHRKIIGGKPKDESEKKENGHATEPERQNEGGDEDGHGNGEDQSLLRRKAVDDKSIAAKTKVLVQKASSFLSFSRYQAAPIEKEPASMGKILNLMRNDVYETAQRFWEFQSLIMTPLGLVLSLVLIWRLLGWASLAGIAVVIVAQLMNAILARILLSVEKSRRKATDVKLQQITQYVETIRHMRWYGWHARKLEIVMKARQKELNLRILTFVWNNVILFVNTFTSGILPVAAFWAYTTLAGQQLSVEIAFPALQLFTMLQLGLRDVPNIILTLLNASIAVRRIEDFMSEPDVAAEGALDFTNDLELKDASFAWPGVRKNVLQRLNISFPAGITIVVGPVASGKSALLQALLGELDLHDGQLLRPDAPIGYCAQTPWLESMSIRDNILFCSTYEEARYKQVLEACALLPDLASFKQGDMSPIGENGIGLSGGQKARVALARAVYSRAQILLLDDPISALDQQTAEWIVAKCLSGNLVKGRTVVLVTHRIDLCRGISQQIVEMADGEARTYEDTTEVSDESPPLFKVDSPAAEMKQANESAAIKDKFEDDEFRAHGGVQLNVYWEYIKAGQLRWWFFIVLSILLFRSSDYAQSWFLKEWGEAYKSTKSTPFTVFQTAIVRPAQNSPLSRFFNQFPDPAKDPEPWLFWFMMLVISQAVVFIFGQVVMLTVVYIAGKRMFSRIMVRISNATFRFYDVTPVGRLMNRLTGDVSTVDGPISIRLSYTVWETVAWVLAVLVIASVTPLFLMFSIALSATFVYVFSRFMPASQSLRRLEMVSLSPLMSNFGALLNGLVTVRAFHAQLQFQDRVIRVTDAFQKMDHFYWSLQSWLQWRFEFLSAVSTFLLTMLAIFSDLSPGLTAFVLIAAQKFVQATHRLCKQYGQLQLDFVSVERVVELLHLEQEDPGNKEPPAYWPSLSSNHPAVEFQDVTMRYAPHLEPAIMNISFSIPPGSSTAVIGRTGSGKSTMALALLATMKPDSGRILVDGIDISKVSKQELRSRVTFLAQEPVLFEGTLRANLDPLSDYSDTECTSVIERIHGHVKYQWTLDTSVEAGGKNLSQGQRQLVGLARAILRRSALIIMDEATASVDLETSWEVQRVLKEELAGSTVITIAHRASAVRDCDLVIKLDQGTLVAFGKPAEVEVGFDRGDENHG